MNEVTHLYAFHNSSMINICCLGQNRSNKKQTLETKGQKHEKYRIVFKGKETGIPFSYHWQLCPAFLAFLHKLLPGDLFLKSEERILNSVFHSILYQSM